MTSIPQEKLPQARIIDVIEFPEKVVTIPGDHTIAQALELLSEYKIRSLPIIANNKETMSIDIVDFADITNYFVECYIKKNESLEKFFETKVEDIANFSNRNPSPATLSTEDTVMMAIKHLKKGMKRVFVQNEDKKLVGVITHTDILNVGEKYLLNTELGKKTIGELKIAEKIEVFVDETTSVVEAFNLIYEKQVDFLPVISSMDGSIISVISVRDVKLLLAKGSEVLDLTVMDYISQSRQYYSGATETFPIFFCKNDYPLLNTLQRLLKTHVHRLIVTDDRKLPTGQVTVTNLLEAIFHE